MKGRPHTVAAKILGAVKEQGPITNLFDLTLALEIDYSNAYYVVARLSQAGQLLVTRTNGHGNPLKLQTPPTGSIESGQNAPDTRHTTNGAPHAAR